MIWWLNWFYNQIALYSDQWPCAHICLFRSKTQLPQRLQTSELRDEYVWADSCKGTLRCFSKSAYLIFYRYCECKYPMYLMFTFPLTWSKYYYYQSVSLSGSDLVHHNGCPAMFYILIQILTRLVTVIQCCCTDRVSCCGLGLTFKISIINGPLHFLADDLPAIAFKGKTNISITCKYDVLRNALNIGGMYPEVTHKAESQLPSWEGVFLNILHP